MGRYTGRRCRLILMCVVSLILFVMELVVAYIGNSLSLASDAFAVLSHFISMVIGFFGVRVSMMKQNWKSTYGFPRADVLGAFGNSIFAVALMFSILIEAVKRYINPQKTEQALLVLIAGVTGLFFNVLNYIVFLDCCYCTAHRVQGDIETGDSLNIQNEPEENIKKEKKSEALNIRGVLLHVMGDALGSVVVVIAAIIFYVLPLDVNAPCNWQCYIDPSLTIIMVIIILSSAFPLIKETASILLQMVPKGINLEELVSKLSNVAGVNSIHEVHVWELVSGKNIATLHIKCQKGKDYRDANFKMREIFHSVGIHNVTIQPEYVDQKESLEQEWMLFCNSPCISKACVKQLCCPPETQPLTHVNGCTEPNGFPPTATYRSDGLSINETAAIVIEADGLSDSGQAAKKVQGDLVFVNSTHF
ncbi:calcium/manganese antiporter SLC30A10 isoform X2 [Monodelphis domestica]|uniref:calcium/manganese antiporter SLC30A10 isoform X2 n=1 Tax=Monodelphis domestica TaxID=13616 RepID=UPI0024E19F25|nr:calcium/manganese antiporter SLC30A10 isoform X2 [Monodelphis domestica]